ncbi:MarR family winged helix-turn-helix transcriptional regulator [Thalassobius sp. S69A]|uniref:MarR family winged helix-turn-helix transcriptional regulator n=1 Tax=unclassified Thalassovita TaxID=2619711 RepID=UPI003C79CC4F
MNQLYGMAGHLIRRLHQISTSVFTQRMKEAGIDLTPVQFGTLSALHTNPDVDQATLAGLIAQDRVTIGAVLDRLQNKGLIERKVSPRDRRARILSLTATGRQVLETTAPIVRALQDDILSGLDSQEKDTLLSLMRKVAEAGNDLSRAPLLPPKPR